MNDRLTDKQLRIMLEWHAARGKCDPISRRVATALTEILALRAERAKPTHSDEERAGALAIAILTDCAMRYIEGPQSQIDRAIDLGTRTVLPALASIRAEGSAERAKLEAEIQMFIDAFPKHPHVPIFRVALAGPAESGATTMRGCVARFQRHCLFPNCDCAGAKP